MNFRISFIIENLLKIFFLASSSNDLDKEVTPAMGRITGSASIETLVRVGIEKEHGLAPDSKMVVLHDFTPCVDDELEVKRGQVILNFFYLFFICGLILVVST